MITTNVPRFESGRVVSTPGALEALERAGQTPAEFLDRHVRGDWGMVSENDKQTNELAVQEGSRIFSAYLLSTDEKLWVITEATGENGRRESTCLLLPDEY